MKKKWSSLVRGVTVSTAIVLLSFASLHPALAAEPINIGFTADFSGSNASSGIQEAPAVEFVVKEINAAGGINGRPINLITQDNGSDPAKAIGNAKMFKEQYHVRAIIANDTSGVAIALKSWAEKNQIPIIAINPQSDKLTDKSPKPWFFRIETPSIPRVEAALAKLKKLGHTKIAFEGNTLAWGTDTLAALKEKAPIYGIKVVAEVLVEPKTKDLTIQARQLKDSGAQALFCAEYDAESAALARAMNSIGWKPYVIHTSAATLTAGLALAPTELFEGWETLQQIDPTKPLIQDIWRKIKDHTGKAPIENEEGPRAWDAMTILASALKLSGNPDSSTAIRDAFFKVKNNDRALGKRGGKGGFTPGKNNLLDIDDLVIYTVRSGKLVVAK